MKLSIPAFALTAAIIWGLAVLLVGLGNLYSPGYGQAFLEVIGSVYPGYDPTVATRGSVIIAALYAVLYGLIGGLVFACLYNVLGRCCCPCKSSKSACSDTPSS
jgi:hypothetical protein